MRSPEVVWLSETPDQERFPPTTHTIGTRRGIVSLEVAHTQWSKQIPEGNAILLVDPQQIRPHEQPNPERLLRPVTIHEKGWDGPALSGFLMDASGKIIPPPSDEIVLHDQSAPELIPVLIDGANRLASVIAILNVMRIVNGQTPQALVPFCPYDYWNEQIVLDTFLEPKEAIPTKQDIINAALTQNLIKPKGSKHGIRVTPHSPSVLPLAQVQPIIRMSLEDIFAAPLPADVEAIFQQRLR